MTAPHRRQKCRTITNPRWSDAYPHAQECPPPSHLLTFSLLRGLPDLVAKILVRFRSNGAGGMVFLPGRVWVGSMRSARSTSLAEQSSTANQLRWVSSRG